MGKNYRILVLEDDEDWLGKHTLKLKQAGFEPHPTQWGEEAIKFIREDTSLDIRGAIIDEILEDPKGSGGPQVVQGSEVVRYIKLKRSDVLCVMVTDVALKRSKNKEEVIGITEELKKASGVEIFHKLLIEKDYNPLIGYLRNNIKPKPEIKADVLFVIGTNNDTIYYFKDDPKIFVRKLGEILDRFNDIDKFDFENGISYIDKLLKKFIEEGRIVQINSPKPGDQGFDLLQATSERMLCGAKPIFSSDELLEILNNNKKTRTREKDIKSRLSRISSSIIASARIPIKKLYSSATTMEDLKIKQWEMKFMVLNPYRALQEKERKLNTEDV